jgi:ribose/xylose/arabinose/galactoside ABC-type transport system permease subunit
MRLGAPRRSIEAGAVFASNDRKSEGLFLRQSVARNLLATRLKTISHGGVINRCRSARLAQRLAGLIGFDRKRLGAAAETLSGGNQQKVFLGGCLEKELVTLLLFDEPTRGVDVGGWADIHNLIRHAASTGACVIFASTELDEIVGEFDFGVLGVFVLCPMIAVKLGETNLFVGLGAALALAALVGLLEGAIVAKLRVHSVPVTLGFYIALLGANIAIGNSQSVSFSNLDVGSALDAAQFTIFSWRSIIALLVFALVFVVMRFTRIGRDVRAVGGDRRASRVVGVEVNRVLIGVFVASALCSALGGILLAYSFATALSNPGLFPLQFAVTAAIIGGVSLAGGGGALGIAAGALTLSLLQELFSLLAAPTYLSSLITGLLLVLATFVAAPDLAARWKSFRSPRPRALDGLVAPAPRPAPK